MNVYVFAYLSVYAYSCWCNRADENAQGIGNGHSGGSMPCAKEAFLLSFHFFLSCGHVLLLRVLCDDD